MASSSSPSPSQSSRVVRPGFSNGKTRKICAEEPFACTRAAPEWPLGEARAGWGEIAPQKKTIAVTERIRRIGRVAMSKCIVTDADWQEPLRQLRGLGAVRRINAPHLLPHSALPPGARSDPVLQR